LPVEIRARPLPIARPQAKRRLVDLAQVAMNEVGRRQRVAVDRQYDQPFWYYDDLTGMARDSDYLIVVCPGGEATHHIVNREVLDALGPEGTLINIARGSVVDEPELVAALEQRRLGGAGLDVFAAEPRVPESLLAMDHVVLQPHLGSATVETRQAMGELMLRNLAAYFAGEPVPTPVTR